MHMGVPVQETPGALHACHSTWNCCPRSGSGLEEAFECFIGQSGEPGEPLATAEERPQAPRERDDHVAVGHRFKDLLRDEPAEGRLALRVTGGAEAALLTQRTRAGTRAGNGGSGHGRSHGPASRSAGSSPGCGGRQHVRGREWGRSDRRIRSGIRRDGERRSARVAMPPASAIDRRHSAARELQGDMADRLRWLVGATAEPPMRAACGIAKSP